MVRTPHLIGLPPNLRKRCPQEVPREVYPGGIPGGVPSEVSRRCLGGV